MSDDMDLESLITSCENELYLGFTNVESSGLTWLNKVCGKLSTLCRHLQTSLSSKTNRTPNAVDTALLCTSQILCCIKYVEKALVIEMKDKIVLTSSRQFFLDRIMWCLSRIKTIADSSLIVADTNFVHLMDVALDLIAPLTLFASEADTSNIAKHHAEVSIESAKIRSVVDTLIGQVLAFVNVTSEEDKKPLTCMCQKVLRDSIAFEESCSMLKDLPDEQNRRLKAATLENSFYQLDRWINDSLLKLVFAVFVELKMDPIQKLRDICHQSESCQDVINEQVERIDVLFEKIVQIGNFALSFSWDYRTKSNLRSSLASLESLDSYLIPAILSHSNAHSDLLHNHWNDEIVALIDSIQNIIDTQAFCASMIDIFSTSIINLTQSFDKEIVRNLLSHCDVLKQHFEVNFNDLTLGTDSQRSLYFEDFLLMVKECNAAVVVLMDDEKDRIIKRLKILLSVVKKFHATLKTGDEPQRDKVLTFGDVTMPATKLFPNINLVKTQSMEMLGSETVKTEQFFQSLGITASPSRKVLYESFASQRKEPKIVDSTFKVKATSNERDKSMVFTPTRRVRRTSTEKDTSIAFTPTRTVQRRASLRRALFKRTKECELKQLANDDTFGLHISDILDQITDLSNTLSNNPLYFEQDSDLV